MARLVRWSSGHIWPLAIGLAVIAIDIVGLAPASSPILLSGGVVAILYGLWEIGSKAYRDYAKLRAIREQQRPTPLVRPYEALYDGWQQVRFRSGHAVIHDKVNDALLAESEITIEPDPHMWRPTGQYEEYRRLLKLRLDEDQSKVRLSKDLLPGDRVVRVEKTAYSAFVVTNRLGAYRFVEKGGHNNELLSAEDALFHGGRLPALSRSRCSNHLGVDVLAITADGRIPLIRQSPQNQLSAGLLATSGSGSMDWGDLRPGDNLGSFLKRGMLREMREELGLSQEASTSHATVRILGYARFSHLGGKPQFMGVAKLDAIYERIKGIEHRYIDDYQVITFDPDRPEELVLALKSFQYRHRKELSFPLFLNLHLLRRWLESDSRALAWLGHA
jgi:hypothetical protein